MLILLRSRCLMAVVCSAARTAFMALSRLHTKDKQKGTKARGFVVSFIHLFFWGLVFQMLDHAALTCTIRITSGLVSLLLSLVVIASSPRT